MISFFPMLKWIDLGVGVVLVLSFALFAPGSGVTVPLMGYGLLWLAAGWKCRLPLSVVAVLLGVASRHSLTQQIAPLDMGLLTLGLLAVVLSFTIPQTFRWAGGAIGALLGLLLWSEPALWLSAACILPRLATLNPTRARSVAWGGILVGAGGMITAMSTGRTGEMFLRPGEADTYASIAEMAQTLFAQESLLLMIGLVGIFELAQASREQPKWNFRNLAPLSIPMALVFMDPNRVLTASLWVGFPAAAAMLTRWTLALPNLPVRIGLWGAFLLLLGATA